MQITFPCGAKGEPDFCPKNCQYGRFCKMKDKKIEQPRGLQPENKEQAKQDIPKIEIY